MVKRAAHNGASIGSSPIGLRIFHIICSHQMPSDTAKHTITDKYNQSRSRDEVDALHEDYRIDVHNQRERGFRAVGESVHLWETK